jgi:uncharacterized protein (TIGR03086 family)
MVTLLGLIALMTAQHHGFAAAAAAGDGGPARWQPRRLGPDPVAGYRASAETVLAAFAADGAPGRKFLLSGFSAGPLVSAAQAISYHFVDYVVHSWDVAHALGLEPRFPPGLLAEAVRVAEEMPDDEARLAPGAASPRPGPRRAARRSTGWWPPSAGTRPGSAPIWRRDTFTSVAGSNSG